MSNSKNSSAPPWVRFRLPLTPIGIRLPLIDCAWLPNVVEGSGVRHPAQLLQARRAARRA